MRDLQQEVYEIIRDSKDSLWDTAGKILLLNHRYNPVLCMDCDEMIDYHHEGTGHNRCAVCGEIEHDE